MRDVFAPGCALSIHRPDRADRLTTFLSKRLGPVAPHLLCCRHEPALTTGTRLINVCPGCDKRYRTLFAGISTGSLWEALVNASDLPFPDYRGANMAVLDASPTRGQPEVHEAVRALLVRMDIEPVEPKATRAHGICCGDSFYGILSNAEMKALMRKRAQEMPTQDVAVGRVSCAKSMHIGGRQSHYLVDLLFWRADGSRDLRTRFMAPHSGRIH